MAATSWKRIYLRLKTAASESRRLLFRDVAPSNLATLILTEVTQARASNRESCPTPSDSSRPPRGTPDQIRSPAHWQINIDDNLTNGSMLDSLKARLIVSPPLTVKVCVVSEQLAPSPLVDTLQVIEVAAEFL